MMIAKGELTLINGTATVPLTRIPSNALVLLSPKTPLGVAGLLSWSVTARASFTVTSANPLDVSVVGWAVFA